MPFLNRQVCSPWADREAGSPWELGEGVRYGGDLCCAGALGAPYEQQGGLFGGHRRVSDAADLREVPEPPACRWSHSVTQSTTDGAHRGYTGLSLEMAAPAIP